MKAFVYTQYGSLDVLQQREVAKPLPQEGEVLIKVAAVEFIRRFLQHVLPKGFVKVRYYGFLAPCRRLQLATLHCLLWLVTGSISPASTPTTSPTSAWVCRCPNCGQEMQRRLSFKPSPRSPPADR